MRRLTFWQRTLPPVLALVILGGTAGCVSTEQLADRIAAAPNLRVAPPRISHSFNVPTSPLKSMQVPVSDPRAMISVLVVPPGKYPGSEVHLWTDGDQRHLELKIAISALGWKFVQQGRELPEKGTIFLLHGYSMFKEMMIPWAFTLAQAGYRCVLMDLRGHGESTGETFSFGKYETKDLVQVLDHLERDGVCEGPVGVLGVSFGANLAMHWAAQDDRVESVVAIAPYNDPVDAAERLVRELRLPITRGSIRNGVEHLSGKLDVDWSEWTGSVAALESSRPIFFIGGGCDRISPAEEVMRLKGLAPEGSRLLILPESNHEGLGLWTKELVGPVKGWFDERLETPAGNLQ